MDTRKKSRIKRQQRALLKNILFARPDRRKPVLDREMVAAARRKYAGVVRESLSLFYPFFTRFRALGDDEVVALFQGGATELEVGRTIDALHAGLSTLRLSAAAHDLLSLERAMSHCRFQAPFSGDPDDASRALQKWVAKAGFRAPKGLGLVCFKTTLGQRYPELEPRKARPLGAKGPQHAVVFLTPEAQLAMILA